MVASEAEATKIVQKHVSWFEKIWSTKGIKWNETLMKEMFDENTVNGWQGQYTKGIKDALQQWTPCQGAITNWRNLSFEINTFSDTMISYTAYNLFTDFNGKEHFNIGETVIDLNKDGKVCKQTMTAKQNMQMHLIIQWVVI